MLLAFIILFEVEFGDCLDENIAFSNIGTSLHLNVLVGLSYSKPEGFL